MEPKPHPLWANETAREMLADLERAATIEEWNLCVADLVSFLITCAAPRPSADWPDWVTRGLLLREKVARGFVARSGRPSSLLVTLDDIHVLRGLSDATFADAALCLRSRARITLPAARKRVLRAEKVGGFKLPRKGPYGRKTRL